MTQSEERQHLFYLKLAKKFGENNSNCKRRSIGAILPLQNDIIFEGANGTCKDCEWCSRDEGNCPASHAEVNAVLEGRHAIGYLKDLYVFAEIPCVQCLSFIKERSKVETVYCVDQQSYATYYPAVLDYTRRIQSRREYACWIGLTIHELELPTNF